MRARLLVLFALSLAAGCGLLLEGLDGTRCDAGHPCGGGLVCLEGRCAATCGERTDCGGACADLASDPLNCGACGTTCEGGLACVAGACAGPSSDAATAGADAGADAATPFDPTATEPFCESGVDGGACFVTPSPHGTDWIAGFALSRSDMWLGGRNGVLEHHAGDRWRRVPMPAGTGDTYAITGFAPDQLYFLTQLKGVQRWDGGKFVGFGEPSDMGVLAIAATSAEEILAVGGGYTAGVPGALRWRNPNTNTWTKPYAGADPSTLKPLRAVWANGAGLVVAAGTAGSVLVATRTATGTYGLAPAIVGTEAFNSVWGAGTTAWAAGDNGALYRYDGNWTQEAVPNGFEAADFANLSGTGPEDVWVTARLNSGNYLLHRGAGGWVMHTQLLTAGYQVMQSLFAVEPGAAVAGGLFGTLAYVAPGKQWARFDDTLAWDRFDGIAITSSKAVVVVAQNGKTFRRDTAGKWTELGNVGGLTYRIATTSDDAVWSCGYGFVKRLAPGATDWTAALGTDLATRYLGCSAQGARLWVAGGSPAAEAAAGTLLVCAADTAGPACQVRTPTSPTDVRFEDVVVAGSTAYLAGEGATLLTSATPDDRATWGDALWGFTPVTGSEALFEVSDLAVDPAGGDVWALAHLAGADPKKARIYRHGTSGWSTFATLDGPAFELFPSSGRLWVAKWESDPVVYEVGSGASRTLDLGVQAELRRVAGLVDDVWGVGGQGGTVVRLQGNGL